jgi:3-hydroxyacyl-[acyl-carrier-protein] dehydratase
MKGKNRMNIEQKQFNINQIMKFLPHRYPLLLIDKVIDVQRGAKVVAVKNVSYNEQFFQGHFPGHPVMPGVLLIEAMAQAAGILVMDQAQDMNPEEYVVYFMGIEDAHFRKPVVPGDVVFLHVEKVKNRGMVWKMKAEAKVDDVRVANASFSAMIVKKEQE